MEIESVRSERDDNIVGGLVFINIKCRIKSNFGLCIQYVMFLNISGNYF